MSFSEEDLLFQDRYAPVTSSIGFIEEDCARVVDEFLLWQEEIRLERNNIKKSVKKVITQNMERTIQSVLPLKTESPNRYLFIPTNSPWTAYLENGYRGTDPTVISYLPERLECRSIWVVAIPDSSRAKNRKIKGRNGSLILEIYGHEIGERLNMLRSIRLVNDLGKWDFVQFGDPFRFEHTERYEKRKKVDRLDFALLKSYLKAMGLSPFEVGFYLPANNPSAVIIEKDESDSLMNKDISLKESRLLNGIS